MRIEPSHNPETHTDT